MIQPADVVDSAVHFTYSRQTGSYPETGFEEVTGLATRSRLVDSNPCVTAGAFLGFSKVTLNS
jgi:hypothetical protein